MPARPQPVSSSSTKIGGVRLYHMPVFHDTSGSLTFGEGSRHLPFAIKRYFAVYRVSAQYTRGEHAHRRLEQMLICVNGSCRVSADDGAHKEDFLLDDPAVGLYLPPMIWATQHTYSEQAVLLVLASDIYDPTDYINEYAEFQTLLKK